MSELQEYTRDRTIERMFDEKEFITPLQSRIISILQNYGSLPRRDIVKLTNTPRTTVYDNLVKLHKLRIIEKFSRNNGKRGRPLIFWKLHNNTKNKGECQKLES